MGEGVGAGVGAGMPSGRVKTWWNGKIGRLWGEEKELGRQKTGRNQRECGEGERSPWREFNLQLSDLSWYPLTGAGCFGQTLHTIR